MATLIEETVQIKVSHLIKKSGENPVLLTPEFLATVESVAEELIGDAGVVELEVK